MRRPTRDTRRARRWAALALACCVVAVVACSDPPSTPHEAVEAPSTPEAQLEALRTALAEAERDGRWVRAEVLLETLVALDSDRDSLEHRVQLRRVRRHRQIVEALDEVAELLEADAWRAADRGLDTLERLGDELTEAERARIERLRELTRIVEGEVGDSALIDPPR